AVVRRRLFLHVALPISYAGKTFPELLVEHPGEILGPRHDVPGGFPLLYKFIAAREKLSVQVHPGSGSLLGEAKTECWYVVDALRSEEHTSEHQSRNNLV